MTERRSAFLCGLCFWLLLLLCYSLYSKGFSGDFMFDDFPNLEPLGYWGNIDSLEALRNYVASGFAGPTGRPVALLSFLIDANSWPAEPYSFKRTNVLLHLLAGCGVLLFSLKLVGLIYPRKQNTGRVVLACIFITSLWLLHPFWVSTTLYVVQRMAILSALFGIFSLLCYLNARQKVLREGGLSLRVLFWLVLSGVLFVLGVYSKENVVILPISILILELLLQTRSPLRSKGWRLLIFLGCVLPSAVLFSYFLYRGIQGWDVTDSRRGFTAGERFLTQGRVLWIYVANLIFPQPYTSGLYTEVTGVGEIVSWVQGMFGWLGFISLMAVGWVFRNKWPLLFLAPSLYVAAHLVESSVIPLELYFEHRNYFPGIFLFLLPLQLAFSTTISRAVLWMLSLTTLLVVGALLWMRASLWADYPSLVETWADRTPNSVRAQLETSKLALQSGDITKAFRYYSNAERAAPDDMRTGLWGVFVRCASVKGVTREYSAELASGLSMAPDSGGILQYLTVLVEQAPNLNCRGLNVANLEEWLLAYRNSKETTRKTEYRVGMLLGINAINAGAPDQALSYFRESIWGLGQVNSGMLAASRLAAASYDEEARMLLDEVAAAFEQGVLKGDDVDYDHEIKRLGEMLQND